MLTMTLVWAAVTTLWAVVATIMLIRNPLPFPDRGHRAYGIPDEHVRGVVLRILSEIGNLKERFTFDAGPTHQTLMWDGHTIINRLDTEYAGERRYSGNGLSLPVKSPTIAAERARTILTESGYTASVEEIADNDLPPDHLVVVTSNAFNEWALVFRRSLINMPRPKTRKISI